MKTNQIDVNAADLRRYNTLLVSILKMHKEFPCNDVEVLKTIQSHQSIHLGDTRRDKTDNKNIMTAQNEDVMW